MKKYIPLGIYYIIILLISHGVMFFISLIFIILAIALIIFYKIVKDDTIVYTYLLLSIISLIFPFLGMNPYSPITLSAIYSLLSLPLYHFMIFRFKEKYGKIHVDTLTYGFLTLPLSFLSVYFFLFVIPVINFWTLIILVFILILLILYLSLPKS